MACTEAYKEHIEYTFNAFCRDIKRRLVAALFKFRFDEREV